MNINIPSCRFAYRLSLISLALSLLGFVFLCLQFAFRKEFGESFSLMIGSLLAFFGFLVLSHVFAGWLAVLNGLSWVEFGLEPILKPLGGVAFSLWELRAVGKVNGWV